jgi:hypothetical protein
MKNLIIDQNLCAICLEPISDPVCVNCYAREIYSWAKDKEKDFLDYYSISNMIKSRVSGKSHNRTICILCKEESLTVCSYCLFLTFARLFKVLDFSNQEIQEFLETFNYTLGYSEYEF